MEIQTMDISMKDDLQELINSIIYITKFNGYPEDWSAEEAITNPEFPPNGKKENVRLECVYNENNEMINFCEYQTCSGTPLVPERVLHFFGLKPCKNAFLKGSCSETEVSEQLYYIDNKTIFLGGFYIKQNQQKNGLGKIILNMYENKWKIDKKYNRIILNVDIKNWVAIRFWFNNGYNKIIKWIGDLEYSDTAYAMLRLEKEI